MRRIHPLGPWFANRQYFRELDLALLTQAAGRRGAERRRRGEPLHDAERHRAAREGAEPDQGGDAGAGELPSSAPAASRTVFSLADVTSIVFTRQVRTAATPTAPMFTSSPLPTPALSLYPELGRHDRLRRLQLARLRDGREGDPGRRQRHRHAGSVQGVNRIQFNLFLPAGTAPAAGWPVAILRPRLHRQRARKPVRGRILDGPPRNRDRRDQRRRPRWRRARHADGVAHVGCIGHPRCRRPRDRPERRRRDRLVRGQSAPHRRTRSSRAATGCARP